MTILTIAVLPYVINYEMCRVGNTELWIQHNWIIVTLIDLTFHQMKGIKTKRKAKKAP